MKVAILTTQTIHHTWFVRELSKHCPDLFCVLETRSIRPKFPTQHPFEQERDQYEENVLLSGEAVKIEDISETIVFENVNSSLGVLKEHAPDIIVVFGTRKIEAALIHEFEGRIINLHGGDPEEYRGLDSHLWAIYHNDFKGLVTTLHHVNPVLDDGHIISKQQIDLSNVTCLSELRAANTKACLDLVLSTLKTYEALGKFISFKQNKIGRYYSFMPTDLKEICVKKFNEFVLKNENRKVS